MNILFLTSSQKPKDGWSVVGVNIVNNLNNNIEVFSSEDKKKIFFKTTSLKSELFEKVKYLALIYDFFCILFNIKNKPNIIHCNVEHYAVVAMLLSKVYKVPYTITSHGTYGVLLPSKYFIFKKAFENASKVITVSNFTKKRMVEEGIKCNYEVIFNGVDKNKFKAAKISKDNLITFVGNLKPRKGLEFLLKSMVFVNKEKPEIKLVIIGNVDFDSKKYLEFEKYIKNNNLNVKFLGKVSEDDLRMFYQKAKLNILPSQSDPYYFEGFGLIHLEANSCGTLTIGTQNSGNEDAIHKDNGYLVEYGDIKSLSNKILNVFNIKDYPEIDISKFDDWKEVSNKYEILFNSLVNS